jgi:hypothetical protein
MIKKAEYFAGKVVFEDPENHRVYRRVVGALGWAEPPEPGFLVVLAEGLTPEKGLGTRPLWLLAEVQGATVPELYRQCRVLGRLYQVDSWLTDLERPEEVNWFMHMENERTPGVNRTQMYLSPAAYTGGTVTLGVMLQLVDEQCQVTRKVLTFGEGREVAAIRQALSPEDLSKPARNYPGMAALGYAVAELVLNGEPEDWQAAPKHKTMKDYQPGQRARR